MTTATRTYAAHAKPLWQRALLTREFAVIAALIAVFIYSSSEVPAFDGPLTVYYLLLDGAAILLIALPMTMIIITGEIDLSVASTVALSGALLGLLHQHGMSIPSAALVALLAGAVCGAFNGFLVAYVGLPSLAVTIGTLALYRGLAAGMLGTKSVTDFPKTWTDLAKDHIGDSSYPLIIVPFLVLAVGFTLLLHFTPFGRGVFDIGLNDEAAHFSGVNVARTKFILFVLAGVVAAFAGLYTTLRFGSIRGDSFTGIELQVIAAVLLGGVSIFGGRGALHGVIAGVLLIRVISSALRLEGVTDNITNIIIGLLLVLSVMSTSFLSLATRASAGMKKRSSKSSDERQPMASAHTEGKNR